MKFTSLSPALLSFLSAHGLEKEAKEGLTDLPALVRAFAGSAPAPASDPFSPEALSWDAALLDCIGSMDERLYEHFRALVDLFRAEAFRAPRQALLACPGWADLRLRAVRMGILPEDFFGGDLPRPHPGVPEIYHSLRKEALS